MKRATPVRRTIREILAVAFWLHSLYITGLVPTTGVTLPNLSRYVYNSVLLIFIINYSLFSDRGWWSVLFDLIYIYFLPFIYAGKLCWYVAKFSFKSFRTKIIWENPQFINIPIKTVAPTQTTASSAKDAPQNTSKTNLHQRVARLFLKFAILWSLLILSVDSKPLVGFAVFVTILGVSRAIINLWKIFSGGGVWLNKLEIGLANKILELLNQISGWDGISNPEPIRQAANSLKLYSSVLNFITDNTSVLTSWAFTASVCISVPFYCYISLLFACVYVGIAKIMTLSFPFQESLVDSLFMPFAWTALPPNLLIRFIAGLQATCVSIIGYNILFRHIGNRLEKITQTATKLRDPFKSEKFKAKLLEVETHLSQLNASNKLRQNTIRVGGKKRRK